LKGEKSNVNSKKSCKAFPQEPLPFQSMERQQKISYHAHGWQICLYTVYPEDQEGKTSQERAEAQ
jgi:hypothetical protein